MSTTFIILGTSVLALLLAGYFAQKYLPPPKPKIVGIDLGTTYSCVGMYHAVTGHVDILEVQGKHKCIPSVVAFSDYGVLIGYKAVEQIEKNAQNTLYDAKRFIGKTFTEEELKETQKQYQFKLYLEKSGLVNYQVYVNGSSIKIRPEDVGAVIIGELKSAAEKNLTAAVTKVVMSVPAEFNAMQRNYTRVAAENRGLDVFRIINEPTAAALAYGLHKHPSLQTVIAVDLGGGTLDVSLLRVQGGMFLTQAMAGNNRLGGQDFNQNLLNHLLTVIEKRYNQRITDKEDLQTLRLAVEEAKLNLTTSTSTDMSIRLVSLGKNVIFKEHVTRTLFEDINKHLFRKVLDPIKKVLQSVELTFDEIDEIVLVGGSTRIPKVREIIRDFFGKPPNTRVDPELAVVTGVAVQAGIIGGMWPLKVSAVELPTQAKKIQVQ